MSLPGGPYSGSVGEPVEFDGIGSSDPEGDPLIFDWDFGDGTLGTGPTPSHIYLGEGVYVVVLTVTDPEGLSGTASTTATIDVAKQHPVANPGGPYSEMQFVPIIFDGSGSYDPDGTIVSYNWYFGDGETDTGVNPSHSYNAASIYAVTLTVTDNDGLTNTATTIADIELDPNCPVSLPGGPYSGFVGEPVEFDGTGSSDPEGDLLIFDWDFGDGTWGTGPTPSHIYFGEGLYVVVLTVTDPDGLSDTASTTATISEDQSLVASNPSPADGAENVDINVTLTWKAGATAGLHKIYFGTDPCSIPLVGTKSIGDETFDPGFLEPSTTYYWSVTEVNNATILPVFTGDIWSFTTKDDIIIVEGCMPGFWYNNAVKHDASAWILFTPDTLFSDVFSLNGPLVIKDKGKNTITDPTLLEALGANGGGVNALIRHGIAAILNACSDCVQYEYSSPDQVISMIEDTLNEVPEAYKINELHSMFAYNNEAGCSVDQHGECVGIEEETDE